MDLAPLSSAHAHARNAAALSQGPNLASAREEHESAAQDFATARTSVGDSEALRILNLLEHHHQQLAEIIKSQSAPAKSAATKDGDHTSEATGASTTTAAAAATPGSEKDAARLPKLVSRTSTSPVRTRRLHRETSSSIADNLARQRRGLPAAAELSNLQAGGRILSHIERPGYSNRPRSPESTRNSSAAHPPPTLAPAAEVAPQKPSSDDSFSKFYTTFEGLFSKLSGPLAFAGLPLTPEQAAQDESKAAERERAKEKTRAASSDDPDLSKIYSAAALKAIREDVGPSFGPQESFYLVPPTGGTVSYAGMVSGGRGSSHVPDTIAEDDDEFVDARESVGPPSPRSLRNSGHRKGTSPVASRDGRRPKSSAGVVANTQVLSAGGKTSEELELEISVLKQLLDTQAKRLQMWEMSSQSQSMALQQSMRAVRQRPDLPTLPHTSSDAEPGKAEAEKIAQLEKLLEEERGARGELEGRMGRVESENKRLVSTVGRYRDKWEQLKAGARKREDDKRRKADEGSTKGRDDS